MMRKKGIFIFLLFLFAAFSAVFPEKADSQGRIEVSPFRIEEVVEPGERVRSFVTVTNASDEPKTFYLFVNDFIAKGERGEVTLIPAGSQEGAFLSSWVETSSQGIDFAPREKKEIMVSFKVPENVGPGGYYGAVVFGPNPPEVKSGEGSVIIFTHKVGVLVLFRVKGDVNEEARVREFTTDKDFYGAPFEVNFMTRVENMGNVHIKPVGSITIENMRGSQVAALPVNSTGANALPDSIRRFDSKWEGDLGFGKYTAYLVLNFGSPGGEGGAGIRTVTAQKTFWILPWDIIVPMGIILFVTIIIAVIAARWYKEKGIKEALKRAGLSETALHSGGNVAMRRAGMREEKPKAFYPILIFVAIAVFIIITGGLIFFLLFA